MKKKRNFLSWSWLLTLLLLVGLIPATSLTARAEGESIILIDKVNGTTVESHTHARNTEFDVDLQASCEIYGGVIEVTFDRDYLELQEGSDFANGVEKSDSAISSPSDSNSYGIVTITLYTKTGFAANTTFATLKFKVKDEDPPNGNKLTLNATTKDDKGISTSTSIYEQNAIAASGSLDLTMPSSYTVEFVTKDEDGDVANNNILRSMDDKTNDNYTADGTDYVAKIDSDSYDKDHYQYDFTVNIGNNDLTDADYEVKFEENPPTITIPHGKINGNITITVRVTPKFTINLPEGLTGDSTYLYKSDNEYTLTIDNYNPTAYTYIVTKDGATEYKGDDISGNGTITFEPDVFGRGGGSVSFTLTKELNIDVNVYDDYVTGYFLVVMKAPVYGDFKYSNEAMHRNSYYDGDDSDNNYSYAYAYLVAKSDGSGLTANSAKSNITLGTINDDDSGDIKPTTDYDVNNTDSLDFNDVYQVYLGYIKLINNTTTITSANMVQYLKLDVDKNHEVNVNDLSTVYGQVYS